MRQVATVGFEEAFDLRALVGKATEVGVDRVEQEKDVDGRLQSGEGLEAGDRTRDFIVEDGEVRLTEPGDGFAGLWSNDYVE